MTINGNKTYTSAALLAALGAYTTATGGEAGTWANSTSSNPTLGLFALLVAAAFAAVRHALAKLEARLTTKGNQ